MSLRRTITALALSAVTMVTAFVPAMAQRDYGFSAFAPVAASAVCTPGGDPAKPLILPAGYDQTIVASEPQFPDLPDMNVLSETGPFPGRYLFRSHEVSSNGSVSVTDLKTGATHILAQRADWERLDGIVWTPWGTLLTAEETTKSKLPDPQVPQATAGLAYEIDPATGAVAVRPAIGSRSHEGLRFDAQGNLYGISESNPGFIFKFVPDRWGDLSSGQLYALRITNSTGDRTGDAVWVPLDRTAVQVNSNDAAAAVGATSYSRPEDVEIATSTGRSPFGTNVMYVAVTGENRVLAIDLGDWDGGSGHHGAYVVEYIKAGVNAPADFEKPDNLALDKQGNLFITEDPGGSAPKKTKGDDIWMAAPGSNLHASAQPAVRFATLTDCDAEPTGIYFDLTGQVLYVNVMHRGGDKRDLAMAIMRLDGK